VDAHLHGGSMMKNVSKEQESHTVGNDIFFKAITSDKSRVSFVLPAREKWIDFWTDDEYEGGTKITKEYSLDRAPLFIRSGAIIPMEITNDITGIGDNSFTGKTTVLIYPGIKNEYLFHKPLGEGTEYTDIQIKFNNEEIVVQSEINNSYIFLLKMSDLPKNVKDSDKWSYNPDSKTVQIEKAGKSFKIIIE
jgi:alpha-glucosidase (family GH31 glycosyl hydrolase)